MRQESDEINDQKHIVKKLTYLDNKPIFMYGAVIFAIGAIVLAFFNIGSAAFVSLCFAAVCFGFVLGGKNEQF